MKNILIIDIRHKRDTFQWNIYKKLRQNNNFNIYICQEIDGDIENVMFEININKIDLIFIGIYHGAFIENSMEYIKKNNIPCIIDSADNEELIINENIPHFIKSGIIDAVITKYLPSPEFTDFFNDLSYDISKLHCIEWGVAPIENIRNKDIDVAFICSIENDWAYHTNRKLIKEILETLECFKIFTENVWGEEYKEILSRSKIFIVEGSMRKSMTQKYLEAGISGCLLIGERPIIPTIAYENFNNNVMIEVIDLNELKDIIINALNNSMLMQEKIHNCIEMIKEKFNINEKNARYEKLFNKILNR